MVGGGGHSSMDHPDAEDLERGELRRDAPEFADGDDGDEVETQYFSDAEDRSWASHSRQDSTAYEDCISPCASARASSVDVDADGEAAREHCRKSSCVSEGSLEDVDLEAGLSEIIKASPEKAEQNCRICHLGLESTAAESGAGITLGCSCKGDLSYAHKQCADTWFKIRGNKICEICSSTASNVVVLGDPEFSDQWSETNNVAPVQVPQAETRRFWQGHRFLNFLLACMVFAFVISWLFHFNVPG
ncbi:unnamed protein product [Miscanthus lutarioriparius]|uniref:RING-CH-type domain-containing protein n=1 Tax=Miscanthus lutarioriparius TaxID=422564 RepID=A0A811RXM9_9POAL|nr:unnamed protein product [Miscanthus lutarioriparius]